MGLTKLSHVAPKIQHFTFCDTILRFDWCRTKRIDSACGVTWILLCAKDGSVITWGRGEGETLSLSVRRALLNFEGFFSVFSAEEDQKFNFPRALLQNREQFIIAGCIHDTRLIAEIYPSLT